MIFGFIITFICLYLFVSLIIAFSIIIRDKRFINGTLKQKVLAICDGLDHRYVLFWPIAVLAYVIIAYDYVTDYFYKAFKK